MNLFALPHSVREMLGSIIGTPLALARLLTTALTFFASLAIFLLLRTNHYASVDGALRCLEVFHTNRIFFHGNNHMLYPFWIFTWAKMCSLLGVKAKDAFEFVRISQAMNSFAAAGTISILYLMISFAAGLRAATIGALLFGLSTANLLHSTNSAEVMPGLFFAMLALLILISGLDRKSGAMLFLSGTCLALALASYEATGIAGIIGAFLCLSWPTTAGSRQIKLRTVMRRLGAIAAGGLFGVCSVYGAAYRAQGIGIGEMPKHLFVMGGGQEVYGGVRLSRILNIPFGLIRNLDGCMPLHYAGIRSLLNSGQPHFWLPVVIINLVLLAAVLLICCLRLFHLTSGFSRIWLCIAVIPCFALAFPLLYWDPLYDKLWLLPLATISFLLAFSLRPNLKQRHLTVALWLLVSCLLMIEVSVNLPRLFQEHSSETPGMADARRLAAIVRENDAIVLDFDDVSGLWLGFWGSKSTYLMFPSSNASQARQWLKEATYACKANNSRILFVGILDQDRKTWDEFLGNRVGIPFESLDEYRSRSRIMLSYMFHGHLLTVRAFNGQ